MVTHVPEAWPDDTEVLSLDLDVRERSSDFAARAIAHAITQLRRSDTDHRVFVKIDSTLRGPVVGLIDGALAASGRSVAMVAPAFPDQGRHVRDGHLVVNGRVGASLVDLAKPLRARAHIVDADSSEALAELARAAAEHPEWLLVGSAGLARQLAGPHTPGRLRPSGRGPILIVAGSPTPVTRRQLTRVTGRDGVVVLSTPPTDTRDAGEAAAALADTVAAWAQEHTPRAVVLTGGATAREVSHRLGATSLRLAGEVQPGIPGGTLEDGVWHAVTVVTKAGGFGAAETLLDVVHALGVSSSTDAHDFHD
ncbi:MAG: hypothetical protein JO057_19150 [Chloroflexi bacterium]|nr:hypothetical protein [Chloroflexota bacterium]